MWSCAKVAVGCLLTRGATGNGQSDEVTGCKVTTPSEEGSTGRGRIDCGESMGLGLPFRTSHHRPMHVVHTDAIDLGKTEPQGAEAFGSVSPNDPNDPQRSPMPSSNDPRRLSV